MADIKKQSKKQTLPEIEEDINPIEKDDINYFIRKTQIQNEILKKIKDNLNTTYPMKPK